MRGSCSGEASRLGALGLAFRVSGRILPYFGMLVAGLQTLRICIAGSRFSKNPLNKKFGVGDASCRDTSRKLARSAQTGPSDDSAKGPWLLAACRFEFAGSRLEVERAAEAQEMQRPQASKICSRG